MQRLFSKEPKLSVLIPHLPERAAKLDRLLLQIQRQLAEKEYPVEVLIHDDRQKTTGEKRNDLIVEAKGEFITQPDDDDLLGNNFFKRIFKYLVLETDSIGFIVNVMMHDKTLPAYHCKEIEKYKGYPECFFRPINHTNVIRKSLCIPFDHITRGEDIRFANKMSPILKPRKGVFIPEVLYHYDATHNHDKEFAKLCTV